MQRALFEVDPAEPLVYIALSITLLLVAEAPPAAQAAAGRCAERGRPGVRVTLNTSSSESLIVKTLLGR